MKEEDGNRRRKKNTSEHSGSEKSSELQDPREERRGLQLSDQYHSNPYLNTQLNTLLIWYQYLLKNIDYIMFYAVKKISLMHFLHLNSCMFVLVNRPQ